MKQGTQNGTNIFNVNEDQIQVFVIINNAEMNKNADVNVKN